jgi:type II secretory ATPase GspE/PulE/Tfp pilus assembly ATPase PilB-like protein
MDPKKNLNNVQRKMLDEVYMEHFDSIYDRIMDKRKDEFNKLEDSLLIVARKKYAKEIAELNKVVGKMANLSDKIYEESGFQIKADNRYRDELEKGEFVIKFRNESRHPKLAAHKDETSKIHVELMRKKKEIRARIYGLDMTYETIEAEIEKEIKDIKY